VLFILNKQLLSFGPERFNLVFNQASRQLFKDRYGRPEDLRIFDKQRLCYELNQKIHDDLAPFKSSPITITLTNGLGILPDDYVHPLGFCSLVYENSGTGSGITTETTVRIADEDKIGNLLASKYRMPRISRPVLVLYANHVQVYPKSVSSLQLTYLKYPLDAKWDYTVVNNRPVYNAATSVQPQWRKINQNDLVIRIVGFLGINLKASQVEQYAQLKQQEGI
jgi:hypothetical protein